MKKTIEIEINDIEIEMGSLTFSFNWKVSIDWKFYNEDKYTSDFSWYKTRDEFEKVLLNWWANQIVLDELEF